ncbi:hypothetical protein Tco_0219508, partial [Tanacetum coccineum]
MSAKGEKIVENSPVFIGQTGGAHYFYQHIPCDSKMDNDSEQEADDDMGYDPSD